MNRFWWSFGFSGCPDFNGLSVLEIGSGTGQRAEEIARHGARRVVGVEPFVKSYDRAVATVGAENISFFNGELKDLPPETFDAIVSENTFEHVRDVPGLLSDIRERLNPSGRLYVAFGPLYHAPDGDHDWLRSTLPGSHRALIPWGHLIFSKTAFSRLSQRFGRSIKSTIDWPFLDLNQHTAAEFERMFSESGLSIAYLGKNYVESAKGQMIAALARIPFLSKYCTLNLAAILVKEAQHS